VETSQPGSRAVTSGHSTVVRSAGYPACGSRSWRRQSSPARRVRRAVEEENPQARGRRKLRHCHRRSPIYRSRYNLQEVSKDLMLHKYRIRWGASLDARWLGRYITSGVTLSFEVTPQRRFGDRGGAWRACAGGRYARRETQVPPSGYETTADRDSVQGVCCGCPRRRPSRHGSARRLVHQIRLSGRVGPRPVWPDLTRRNSRSPRIHEDVDLVAVESRQKKRGRSASG